MKSPLKKMAPFLSFFIYWL